MDKAKEREKMIGLIINAKRTDPETGSFTEWLADYLLDHGVTVPADDVPEALPENRRPAPEKLRANDFCMIVVTSRLMSPQLARQYSKHQPKPRQRW